jgi:uncharacterized protein YegL
MLGHTNYVQCILYSCCMYDVRAGCGVLPVQVQGLTAAGGGDGPEDLLPALHAAASLSWKSRARFLVLITDAPAHGQDCNDDPDDQFPGGSPSGLTPEQAMAGLRQQGVDLMFCRVRKSRTALMEAQMVEHYNRKEEGRELTTVDLFDDNKPPANRFHVVFCLDESGSMHGQPWLDVVNAFHALLDRRLADQQAGDIVTVVQFDESARTTLCQASVASARSTILPYSGGSTSIDSALLRALGELEAAPADCTPLLILMSDGCHNSGHYDPLLMMQAIYARLGAARNLQVHTIAFGHSNDSTLKALATEGRGQYHECATGVELARTFEEIAAGCNAVDGLVEKFSDIISDMISVKVSFDYL